MVNSWGQGGLNIKYLSDKSSEKLFRKIAQFADFSNSVLYINQSAVSFYFPADLSPRYDNCLLPFEFSYFYTKKFEEENNENLYMEWNFF